MKRFFLVPVVVLLLLLACSPSSMAVAAQRQPTVSPPLLHLWAHPAPAAPLLPAVTCSQDRCTGQDPVATGCSANATTLLSKAIVNSSGQSIGETDLRWSPTCQTNWGRVVSFIGSAPLSVSVEREAGNGLSFQEFCEPSCDTFVTATSAFTDMVWAPNNAAAATGGMLQNNMFFKSCVTQDSKGLSC